MYITTTKKSEISYLTLF